MLSLEQCRKIVPSLRELPDEEVKAILDDMYDLGQLAFEDWVKKRTGSKNPVRVIEASKK